MPVDAVFSIASMTKPLVSVAALSLYEEGRLMVNEPVSKYLPQLADMRVATSRAHTHPEHVGESVHAQREMTIQDLMRHTAGITYGNRGSTAFYKSYLSSSDEVAEQITGSEFLKKLAELPCISSRARNGITASASTSSASRSKRCRDNRSQRFSTSASSSRSGWTIPGSWFHRKASAASPKVCRATR